MVRLWRMLREAVRAEEIDDKHNESALPSEIGQAVGQFQQAIRHLNEAHLRLGNRQRAVECYQQALKNVNEMKRANWFLAHVQETAQAMIDPDERLGAEGATK